MYDELKKYTSDIQSFHMPGHKNGKLQLMHDLYALDVTEVPGTDDLHHPSGMIKEVQDRIGRIYQSYQSYLLINGSTSGILATLATVARRKGSVLVSRNCHKAVYNGILINRLEAHYVYPNYDEKYGFYGEVEAQAIEVMLKKHPDIHTVVLTSPTYEGIVSDIQKISQIVHAHGAILLVDEAHGAHLTFSHLLPQSAIELGADYVIQSTHKTLPCLTQTALLHMSPSVKADQDVLEENLAIFQSSSPSYILMASIEKGIDFMETHRKEFEQWIIALRDLLEKHPIQGGQWLNDDGTFHQQRLSHDITRLTFLIDDGCISGYDVSEKLRKEHHMQVELAGERHIVAIISMADSIKDIQRLIDGIRECLAKERKKEGVVKEAKKYLLPTNQPEQSMSMHMAKQQMTWDTILYTEALGRTAKDMIIPYPPGIPLILPGEKITQEIVNNLESLDKHGQEIYGIIKGEIRVLR